MASICSFATAAVHLRSVRALSGDISGSGVQALGPRSRSTCAAAPPPSNVTPLLVQPLASRKCILTGKKANNGYRVSFSHHRTKHLQGVNLQYKRLWWEEANRFVKLRLSTKALKTIEKKGLSVMAKEAGINLLDYAV